MRSRWVSTVLASGVSALLLGCLGAPADVAGYSYPATYKGTTANGGTVEFSVSADGASVTRFKATQIPDTCGTLFSGTVEVAVPIAGESFSNRSPNTGPVFTGVFSAPRRAEGTVSYRIVKVRDDGCYPRTVSWTATTSSRSPVVFYRQEGGIGGPRPSLVVSKGRRATVTFGRCTARFALRVRAWNRLRVALRGADLHAIAGDYPPPTNGADFITYVIKAGRNTVRIASPPRPEHEEVMRDLRPLLKVLNRTVSAGKQRMPPSCKSNRRSP
jgi:hypothetical protein